MTAIRNKRGNETNRAWHRKIKQHELADRSTLLFRLLLQITQERLPDALDLFHTRSELSLGLRPNGDKRRNRKLWMRTVDNESVVKHVETISDVPKMLNPLNLVPPVSHETLIVQRQTVHLLNEQVSTVHAGGESQRFLTISAKTRNLVKQRILRIEPVVY